MSRIALVCLVIGLFCLIQTVFCEHLEDEPEMERRRVYCAQRVAKRETLEIRPVHCVNGFEFCFTSTTCCCEIPIVPKDPNYLGHHGLSIGLSISGILFFLFLLAAIFGCRRMYPRRRYPGPSTVSVVAAPFSSESGIQTYASKYGPPPSLYGAPSSKHGPPTSFGDNDSMDSFDMGKAPLSISGTLPPPPYSEHSFAVGPAAAAGPIVLYKPGRDVGYTKRPSRPSSLTSWQRTQDGASLPRSKRERRSSVGSNRSVARNSRHGGTPSRSGSVINEGFEPAVNDHYMMTIPSVHSQSTRGSTKADSEVIYGSTGNRSRAGGKSSIGRRSSAPTIREEDMASQAGTHVSYNPASATAAMEY